MNNFHDVVNLKLERHEVFTLFNSLLIREKSVFNKANEYRMDLLKRLWIESDDKSKSDGLWSEGFRRLLNEWDIDYKEDLKRLDIPEILEDE